MFHPDTQFLIEYWAILASRNQARGGIPDRVWLEPNDLGLRLPRTFVVDMVGDARSLRLAGSWIETLHDRSLKSAPVLCLWSRDSQGLVISAMAQAIREARPVVIVAAMSTSPVLFEITFAPMRGASGAPDRLLGLYAPGGTFSLGKTDSRLLTARLCVGAGDPGRPPLSLAAVRGRRVA